MKSAIAVVLLTLSPLCVRIAQADSFGSDDNAIEIEFVTIGNAGNFADTTGFPNSAGSVDYVFRIGKYEISEDIINKANGFGGLGITHDNRGAGKPATSVSWFEAAQFVNWLNTSSGSPPAYKFGAEGSFQLWQLGDDGYDPNNLYRNSLARYFLPGTHEWYKAAYYDPTAGVYYDYPTGSNSQPDGLQDEEDPVFDAVFFDGDHNSEPNDATNVGIPSPYGTRGQGGNIAEWIESAESLDNGQPPIGRHVRGGQWDDTHVSLRSNIVGGGNASTGHSFVGFRVASQVISFLPGDYNRDGTVNTADYDEWKEAFGNPVAEAGLGADGNVNGIVDAADYTVWRDHLAGMIRPGRSAGVPVPEPATPLMALIAAVCPLLPQRSRRT
jgi:hypothetical protein